jgi:phosphoglycolate phosphatase
VNAVNEAERIGRISWPATVLFDWNGTLVDDLARSHAAACGVLQSRGLPVISIAQFRERFTLPLAGFFADLGVPAARCAAAERQWNALATQSRVPLRDGVARMLRTLTLRGTVLGIVSAASSEALVADLRAAGTADLFHVVIGGSSNKAEAIRPFTAHRPVRGSVCYIGDTEHDMSCAREAGATAIGITAGYRPAEALLSAGAQYLVSDLAQIPAVLAEIPAAVAANSSLTVAV